MSFDVSMSAVMGAFLTADSALRNHFCHKVWHLYLPHPEEQTPVLSRTYLTPNALANGRILVIASAAAPGMLDRVRVRAAAIGDQAHDPRVMKELACRAVTLVHGPREREGHEIEVRDLRRGQEVERQPLGIRYAV